MCKYFLSPCERYSDLFWWSYFEVKEHFECIFVAWAINKEISLRSLTIFLHWVERTSSSCCCHLQPLFTESKRDFKPSFYLSFCSNFYKKKQMSLLEWRFTWQPIVQIGKKWCNKMWGKLHTVTKCQKSKKTK